MEVILGKLKRHSQAENSAKAYLCLISLIKEGGKFEETHEGDLLFIIRLWLKEEDGKVMPNEALEQTLSVTLHRIIRVWV